MASNVYAKGTHDFSSGGESPAVSPSYKDVKYGKNIGGSTKGRALTSGAVRGARKNGTANRLQAATAIKNVSGLTGPNKY